MLIQIFPSLSYPQILTVIVKLLIATLLSVQHRIFSALALLWKQPDCHRPKDPDPRSKDFNFLATLVLSSFSILIFSLLLSSFHIFSLLIFSSSPIFSLSSFLLLYFLSIFVSFFLFYLSSFFAIFLSLFLSIFLSLFLSYLLYQ